MNAERIHDFNAHIGSCWSKQKVPLKIRVFNKHIFKKRKTI